jgi:hypothetical protein
MPNRMLRDWTQSDKIDQISCEGERFFTRLIMKVDDYGSFWADTRLLKANLFPLKLDKVREADMLRWMTECQKAGLIVLYEIDQKKYLQIIDFKQRLDKSKAKFPFPPVSNDSLPVVNDFPAEVEVEVEKETELEKKENSIGASAPAPQKIDLGKKQKEFYDSLVPFVKQYGKKLIRSFYEYWSEPNKSKTRIKWEMEKTWDLGKRLIRWQQNDDRFSKNLKHEEPAPKQNASKSVDDDINFLLEKFIESGEINRHLINPEYYDRLVMRDKIPLGKIKLLPGESIEEKKVNGVVEYFNQFKKLQKVS